MPRWQPLSITPSEELLSSKLKKASEIPNYGINRTNLLWDTEKNLVTALEVLEFAVLNANFDKRARDAAIFVSKKDSGASSGLQNLGAGLLDEAPVKLSDTILTKSETYRRISTMKSRLQERPNDALSAIEIGRLQCMLGQHETADKYVRRAVLLAPKNRYILRSASRYYFGIDGADTALKLLRRNPALNDDPWLKATEIAYCGKIRREAPITDRQVRNLLGQKNPSKGNSELCASIAAISFAQSKANNRKMGRQLIHQALKNPTPNALAQYEWDRQYVRSYEIPLIHNAFVDGEAGFYKSLSNPDATELNRTAQKWFEADPLGGTAAIMGSCLLLAAYPSHEAHHAIKMAEMGLDVFPDDTSLLNNKCVAKLRLNQLDEGANIVRQLARKKGDDDPFVLAALGLEAYRRERFSDGLELYEKAMQQLIKNSKGTAKNRSQLFHCVMAWFEEANAAGQIDDVSFQELSDTLDSIAKKLSESDRSLGACWKLVKARIVGLKNERGRQLSFLPYSSKSDLLLGASHQIL